MVKTLRKYNMDDTMSEEIAFMPEDKKEETFKFDDDESVKATDSSLSENNDTVSETPAETEVEEQRVPYSRFKKKEQELHERDSVIARLEERLGNLEQVRTESKPEETVVPQEWTELYGDSEMARRAFKVQQQREQQLEDNAVRKAIAMLKEEESKEQMAVKENTQLIEDNLSSLQQSIGKKFNSKTEEDILAIVDEFSPVGSDGKYASLFPFDKAYEIYELRNQKATAKTTQARQRVADLTNDNSSGEVESQGSDFKRGWDSWREAL